MKQRGIIIGGGIAGLSAGIHAQLAGYETVLFEKNPMLGGECSGWSRDGYNIDNCIHWLMGCRPNDKMGDLWRNLGVMADDIPMFYEDCFYQLKIGDKTLHFWRDLEKARKEFLSFAPEDEAQLQLFFDSVKAAECLEVPCEKSIAEMTFIQYMKYGMKMAPMGAAMKEYGKESIADFTNRFHNSHVRAMMGSYFNDNYPAIVLMSSYAFYTSRTGALPQGGSVGMVQRMKERYESLGGVIHLSQSVTKIVIEGKRATEVVFADHTEKNFDFVISTVDTTILFGQFLDSKYMDKKLKSMYEDREHYPVSSGFNVSFGIVGEEDYGLESGSTLFACQPYKVGTVTKDFLGIRVYDYDETLFPRNKRVIQTNLLQSEEDYAFWKELYQNKTRYEEEKKRIEGEIMERILAEYPLLEGKLKVLCSYSPVTFTRWCGAYQGAYMSFIGAKGAKSLYVKNKIKDLSNVYIASQWLQLNGGLPSAAASGRFAVDSLVKHQKH